METSTIVNILTTVGALGYVLLMICRSRTSVRRSRKTLARALRLVRREGYRITFE